MSVTNPKPEVLNNSIYLPDGLSQEEIRDSSLNVSICCQGGKTSKENACLSLAPSSITLTKSAQGVVSCKLNMASLVEEARIQLLLKEDEWEQNFVHRVTCIGLSGFRCMEYGRLFFLAKGSQPSLPSAAYCNIITFGLCWLAHCVANTALIYKNPHIDSHKVANLAYSIGCIVKYTIVWSYFCTGAVDLAMNATTIYQGADSCNSDVVHISIVLVILDGISLLNELVYFAVPTFAKARQMLAKKNFTGSFFPTGTVSRLEDTSVQQGITVLRNCVSKARSAVGFAALGIAGAITITSSSIYWQKDNDVFSSEHIILVEKLLAVCFILVILFGYVMRR